MYYKTLQVKRKSSPDEIKAAYKRLALLTHPDKCNGSQESFLEVRKAYEVLSDAELRREYDNMLRREHNKLAGFVRPPPLQSVIRPVQFALADSTLYSFETATHLLRCGIEYGDVIMFNKQMGYFLGLAGNDYLYWCRTGEQHATQLCHRESTFALSSVQVIQRNYIRVAHHTHSTVNTNLHHKATNCSRTDNYTSSISSNADGNKTTSTQSSFTFTSSNNYVPSNESLHTSSESKTTSSNAKSNHANSKHNKELKELERIKERIRGRERCRQVAEMLARIPVEEEEERIRIYKDMCVGIASLRNMYKCVCKKREEEHECHTEQSHERGRNVVEKSSINHKNMSAHDNHMQEMQCKEQCSQSKEEIWTLSQEEEKQLTEENKINKAPGAKEVVSNISSNSDSNYMENIDRSSETFNTKGDIPMEHSVNEERLKNENEANNNDDNACNDVIGADGDDDDDELFIVHENIINEKLFKPSSANLDEEEKDFVDDNFIDSNYYEEPEYLTYTTSSSSSSSSSCECECCAVKDDKEVNNCTDCNQFEGNSTEYEWDDDDDDDDDDDGDDDSIQIEVTVEDLHSPMHDNDTKDNLQVDKELEVKRKASINCENAAATTPSSTATLSSHCNSLHCCQSSSQMEEEEMEQKGRTVKSLDKLEAQNQSEVVLKVIHAKPSGDDMEPDTSNFFAHTTESCEENVLLTRADTGIDENLSDYNKVTACELPTIREDAGNSPFAKECKTKESKMGGNNNKNNNKSNAEGDNKRLTGQNADKECSRRRIRPLVRNKQGNDGGNNTQELFAILQRDNKTSLAFRKELDKQSADELFAEELEFMQAFARKRRPTIKYTTKC